MGSLKLPAMAAGVTDDPSLAVRPAGRVVYDADIGKVRVHDGETPGGRALGAGIEPSGVSRAALSAALLAAPAGGRVVVERGFSIGTTPVVNPGVGMIGDAPIYYSPAGVGSLGNPPGRVLMNRPSRGFDLLQWGEEYLYHWLNLIYAASPAKVALIGDSNTIGYMGQRLATMFSSVPGATVVNYAISGTTLSQWVNGTGAVAGSGKAMADVLATEPDLIWNGYGFTNEPYYSETVADFATALDTFLTTARSLRTIGQQSIVLTTSATMNDGSTALNPGEELRDEVAVAKARPVIIARALKHKCAYFDRGGRMPDAQVDFAAGDGQNAWLDPNRVHTQGAHTVMLANDAYNFATGRLFGAGAGGIRNIGSADGSAHVADSPASYAMGITIQRAPASNGWPLDGFVMTIRAVDGNQPMQEHWSYQTLGAKVRAYRTSYGASPGTWSTWTFLNLTENAIPGAGYELPNNYEDARVTVGAGLAVIHGYLVMTTPGQVAAGATPLTVGDNSLPWPIGFVQVGYYEAGGPDAIEWVDGYITVAGVLTTAQASTSTAVARVYVRGSYNVK